MKNKKISIMGCVVFAVGIPVFANADTFSIIDNYYGGVTGTGAAETRDVIGLEANYGVDSLTVVRNESSSILQISISGDFFSSTSNAASFINAGDVFLSNDGWNPNTATANYSLDSAATGEDWEYVLSWNSDGTVNLYEVDNTEGEITTSTEAITALGYSNSDYRRDQEYEWSSLDSSLYSLGTGTWALDEASSTLTLTLSYLNNNYTLADFGLDGEIGLHWTMTCGNDVIEGIAGSEVPEPATMLLFGAGIAGLAGLRRRK